MQKLFTVKAKIWLYPGKAGWNFVTIPPDVTKEIDFYHAHQKRGWGSLPVHVTIGKTTWETSIFPDKKSSSYLLPMKKAMLVKTSLKEGDMCKLSLEIRQ